MTERVVLLFQFVEILPLRFQNWRKILFLLFLSFSFFFLSLLEFFSIRDSESLQQNWLEGKKRNHKMTFQQIGKKEKGIGLFVMY